MKDRALRRELLRRMEADQRVRKGGLATWDAGTVDADNTAWLKEVVATHGWPGRSLVGKDGAQAAWLLAQHADLDPAFQHACLALLERAVAAGEAEPRQLAYLEDRIAVREGRPQRYGTQFDETGPRPIADPDTLDERRAAVGLGPFADYQARMDELRARDAPTAAEQASPYRRRNGH